MFSVIILLNILVVGRRVSVSCLVNAATEVSVSSSSSLSGDCREKAAAAFVDDSLE